jgi:hypothetical protein
MSDKQPDDGLQGEGNYAAARRFREAEESFVKNGPVDQKAREAADALEGPEANELEAARLSSRAGEIHGRDRSPKPGGDQHPDDAELDQRLKESFPASDPVSTSPGAD